MKTRWFTLSTALIALMLLVAIGVAEHYPQTATASQASGWPSLVLTPLVGGLTRPVHLTHAGDGSNRLFIVEQAGRIRIFSNGALLSTPFLDISDRVRSPASGGGSEEGLLSVAFPPGYSQQGVFYVYYTRLDGDNQVSRFHLSGDANQADPSSEEPILRLGHPTYSNHNGGQLAFGPDGYLYIGTGDGGGGGDPNGNAQNPASLLGKILRIDVSLNISTPVEAAHRVCLPLVSGGAELPYGIPADNPYLDTPGYRPEIWALGLRNPWRFAFDRQNGDLYIGDVGQGDWEEVDYQPAVSKGGENYGWNVMEGSHCYNAATCSTAGFTLPVAEYGHGPGCSITGGGVYRGLAFPSLQGLYFYGDYCSGELWGLENEGGWQSQRLLDTPYNFSAFGEDEAGELYALDLGGGTVYRLEVGP